MQSQNNIKKRFSMVSGDQEEEEEDKQLERTRQHDEQCDRNVAKN